MDLCGFYLKQMLYYWKVKTGPTLYTCGKGTLQKKKLAFLWHFILKYFNRFMPPDDPLGRHGPSLENFLRKRPVVPEHKKQPCPYGKCSSVFSCID